MRYKCKYKNIYHIRFLCNMYGYIYQLQFYFSESHKDKENRKQLGKSPRPVLHEVHWCTKWR